MTRPSAFTDFIEQYPVAVLDGGLATELERRGADIDHPLWSARILFEQPDRIAAVHRSYLEAGADCLITASYQASIQGLIAEGLSKSRACQLLRESVDLARRARAEFAEHSRRHRPVLVAASVGPYGAYLADGSEFRGDYGISRRRLREFHIPRWETLADSGADVLACETIPCAVEAEVLLELLQQTPGVQAWISFSCRDGTRISDGTDLGVCAALTNDCDQVVAVGANCTAPRYIESLIGLVRNAAPNKPVIVYPNSGQTYDIRQRTWMGESDPADFGRLAARWLDAGATVIGGCCQTGPEHIASIRAMLVGSYPAE